MYYIYYSMHLSTQLTQKTRSCDGFISRKCIISQQMWCVPCSQKYLPPPPKSKETIHSYSCLHTIIMYTKLDISRVITLHYKALLIEESYKIIIFRFMFSIENMLTRLYKQYSELEDNPHPCSYDPGMSLSLT